MAKSQKAPVFRVELDVSGSLVAAWELDEETSKRLLAIRSRLDIADTRVPELPAMGFRGFLYSMDGIIQRSFGGFVIGSVAILADPIRSLERLLIGSIPDSVDLPPEIAARRSRIQ